MTGTRGRPVVRWIAIAACLPLAVLSAISFTRVALADYEIHQQKQTLELGIGRLKDEYARLRVRVAYLNSDTGVELLAREQLGWVRPGDTAVIVIRDQEQNVAVGAAGTPGPNPSPTR